MMTSATRASRSTLCAGMAVPFALLLMLCVRTTAVAQSVYRHDHSQHWACREMKVTLRVVGSSPDGLTLLRSDFLRRGMGVESGHGLRFFVDGRLMLRDANIRADSFGWAWKPASLSALQRKHYLVLNVCDHNDHIGVATLWFRPGQRLGLAKPDVSPQPGSNRGDFMRRANAVACCGEGMWPDEVDALTTTNVEEP